MIDFIERRYTESLTLRQIASAVNVSEREAQRSFVAAMGHTPIQHLATHRLMVAQRMLLTTEDSLSTIAQACGFSNQSYFGRCFREHFGCTPSEYRKRGWEDVGSEDR